MSGSITNKVGVVIVSYNSANELAECIAAAKVAAKKAGVESEIVVVDNLSRDNSIAVAKKAGAYVIANAQNEGFAKAVNTGTRHVLKNNALYVLILNPDAVLMPDSLEAMLQPLEHNSRIGATGPAMLDGKGKPATAGYYLKAPSWISVMLFSTFLRSGFIKRPFFVKKYYEETDLSESREVEQIPGACLLTPKPVLDKIGLLDEDFAIWYEDVEWCYRARKKGYKMWFCHDAFVLHEGGVSFEKWQSLDKAVTFYVSMKTFFKKHKPFSYPLVILVLSLNSLLLYVKSRDRSNLVFLKRFLRTKRGVLPS